MFTSSTSTPPISFSIWPDPRPSGAADAQWNPESDPKGPTSGRELAAKLRERSAAWERKHQRRIKPPRQGQLFSGGGEGEQPPLEAADRETFWQWKRRNFGLLQPLPTAPLGHDWQQGYPAGGSGAVPTLPPYAAERPPAAGRDLFTLPLAAWCAGAYCYFVAPQYLTYWGVGTAFALFANPQIPTKNWYAAFFVVAAALLTYKYFHV